MKISLKNMIDVKIDKGEKSYSTEGGKTIHEVFNRLILKIKNLST